MANGLFDFSPATSQGLIGLGAGLLGSGATPGDRISRGLLGFQQGSQAGREQMRLQAERERIEKERQRRAQMANQVLNQYRPEPSQRGPTRAAAAAGEDRYQRGLLASEAIRQGDIGAAAGVLSQPSGGGASDVFGQVDPSKYTPESIRAFQQTGNYSELRPRPEPQQGMEVSSQFGVVDDQGNRFTVVRTNRGLFRQAVGPDGNVQMVPVDSRTIRPVSTQETGPSSELSGLGSSEATKLRDQQVSTENFISTAAEAINMLEESPDINTWTARASGLVNNLQQETKALARQTGVDFDMSNLDPSKHEQTFDRLGIQNSRMRSMITSLAYQRALANNPSGRISTPDFNQALAEVGADASDPRAIKQTLQDVAERTARNFRTSYRVRTGQPFTGSLGLERLQQRTNRPDEATNAQGQTSQEIVSDEELDRLLEKYSTP